MGFKYAKLARVMESSLWVHISHVPTIVCLCACCAGVGIWIMRHAFVCGGMFVCLLCVMVP